MSQAPDSAWETANLHVRWQGEDRTFPVRFPLGEARVLDLLPAARELTEQGTAAAIARARAEGREVSCRAGCGACCRQLVAISVVEAQSLAELVAAMPAGRQAVIRERFAAALRRLEEAGLLEAHGRRGERDLVARAMGSRDATLQALSRSYWRLQVP